MPDLSLSDSRRKFSMPIAHRVTGLSLLVVSAACGAEKKADAAGEAGTPSSSIAAAASKSALLACGGDSVRVQGAREDTLQLNVHGEDFVVGLVPSASGAKYQVPGDSSTFYWNHGARALVQVRGDLLPECDLVPEL